MPGDVPISAIAAPGLGRVLRVGLTVFIANTALLALQLAAGRLLAPFLGSSLETWTALIGIFLAGICLGNAYGGRVADRGASLGALQFWLYVGVGGSLWLLMVTKGLGQGDAVRSLSLTVRIPLLTAIACLPASFALSVATPLAIKLLLPDVGRTGRVVGFIYALGTLGSLVGNFVTGFYLIAHVGVAAIVLATAAALLMLALFPTGPSSEARAPVIEGSVAESAAPTLSFREAGAIVFAASFCSMALELLATRLIAPQLGVSLYTWTGVIGIVLLGIAAGNQLGGWIADCWPRRETLGNSLFFAGLLALGILVIFALLNFSSNVNLPNWLARYNDPVHDALRWPAIASDQYGLMAKVLIWATALFLPPMLLLGTISPQVIRLSVHGVGGAGRTAGRLYALSCAGAIAGTFATGYLLIRLVGSHSLVLLISLALVALSAWVGQSWNRPAELFGTVLVGGVTIFGIYLSHKSSPFQMETNYYAIKYYDSDSEENPRERDLVLDHLIHSHVRGSVIDKTFVADSSYLGYPHEAVQAEFARIAGSRPDPRVLVIGGGGYTLPRWIEAELPAVRAEVAEIDPGVTEFCHRYLGLKRDTKIISHHMDGRQFVQERAEVGKYALVAQDAVNDLSVPYHIMTKEYNDAVAKLLTPDGMYLLTVIDRIAPQDKAAREDDDESDVNSDPQVDGLLLRAAVATMQRTFGKDNVAVVAERPLWKEGGQRVFIIYGSRQPFDASKHAAALKAAGAKEPSQAVMWPAAELAHYLETAVVKVPVLTDDYAPVDQLIARVFAVRRKRQ